MSNDFRYHLNDCVYDESRYGLCLYVVVMRMPQIIIIIIIINLLISKKLTLTTINVNKKILNLKRLKLSQNKF
jgi:hypothetical protein